MTPQTMRSVRQFHFYLGVFFAPMIVLFALSGALQTFRLQEEKGWGSEPPAVIAWMASVHMDSKLPKPKAPEAGEQGEGKAKAAVTAEKPKPSAVKKPSKLPMQIFVTLVSVGLILSAFLGVAIALNNPKTRTKSWAMLAAGAVLPLLLMMI